MHVWKNNTPGKAFPAWGRWRYENTAFLDTTPFPSGKGEEEAASPLKKEANPVSLRSAAPSKGRGSRGHSLLPMEGGAPKGRRLDGGSGMKEREIVSSTPFARAPYPPLTRSPFPNGEGCDTRIPLFSTQRLSRVGKAKSAAASPRIYMGRCPKVCGEQISRLRFSDIIRLTANDKDVSLRSKCRYGRV